MDALTTFTDRTRDVPQITMRATEFQSMIDSARRASLAAKQAMRICEAAASAFKSEVDVLEACVVTMQTKLPLQFCEFHDVE